jgi:hypothetical protein
LLSVDRGLDARPDAGDPPSFPPLAIRRVVDATAADRRVAVGA